MNISGPDTLLYFILNIIFSLPFTPALGAEIRRGRRFHPLVPCELSANNHAARTNRVRLFNATITGPVNRCALYRPALTGLLNKSFSAHCFQQFSCVICCIYTSVSDLSPHYQQKATHGCTETWEYCKPRYPTISRL